MKNLLQHPSPVADIHDATVMLLDALTRYERATSRGYVVIIKVDHPGGVCGYRSFCGGPASEQQSHVSLLEAFDGVAVG